MTGPNKNFESATTEEVSTTSPVWNRDRKSGLQPQPNNEYQSLPIGAGRGHSPVITWIWDDVRETVYENRSVFNDENVTPGIAVATEFAAGNDSPSSTANSDGSVLNWAQAEELVKDGWETLNHSKFHNDLTSYSETDLIDDLYEANKEFVRRGLSARGIVYPFGSNDELVRGVSSELHSYGFSTTEADPRTQNNHLALYRYSSDKNSLADIQSRIDQAVARGRPVVLFGHELIDSTTTNLSDNLETSTDLVSQTITYAKNQGMRWVSPTEAVASMHAFRLGPQGSANIHSTGEGKLRVQMEAGKELFIGDDEGNNGFRIEGGNGKVFVNIEDNVNLQGNELQVFSKYSDDTNAPNDALYYDTTDSQLEYKDANGTIHNLG